MPGYPEFDFIHTKIDCGLTVIEASAGTGKTYSISHLVPRLLLDGTVTDLSQILLVTFTNDAAGELADRVRRVMEKLAAPPPDDEQAAEPGIHRLRQTFASEHISATIGKALLRIDRLSVSTIHAFCLQVLQTEGTLCGLPVLPSLVASAADRIDRCTRDLWEQTVAREPLLAKLAHEGGWQVDQDIRFIQTALACPDAKFEPPQQPWAEFLALLDRLPQRFTSAACNEVRAILADVGAWNQSAPDEEQRNALLDTLAAANNIADPGFVEAVKMLAGAGTWIRKQSAANKALAAQLNVCAAMASAREALELLASAAWQFRLHCLAQIREQVREDLRRQRQITYDGLIETLHSALHELPQAELLAQTLRGRYRVAMVDESQDTDVKQFAIFRRLFLEGSPDGRLILIGDPKQAIYSFRGADVNSYLEARDSAGAKVYSLSRTFRAPRRLVDAVNAVFSTPQAFLMEGLPFQPATSGLDGDTFLRTGDGEVPARLDAWIVPAEEAFTNKKDRQRELARVVAAQISQLLQQGAVLVTTDAAGNEVEAAPVQARDFAVLVQTRYEAAAVADALAERGMPSVRVNKGDVMATEEAHDLLALLRAIHEPRRSGLLRAALATRLLGRNGQEIRAAADAADGQWPERLQLWRAAWQRHGAAAAIALADAADRISERLASLADGERRLTNFRQLSDLIQAAGTQFDNNPDRLLRWLGEQVRNATDNADADERQMQLESDAAAIQITTMHAAKGLEYKLVFCPFLWSPLDPKGVVKLNRRGKPPLFVNTDLSGDAALRAQLRFAALEDGVRLAYVALTRARVKLWLVGGEVANPTGRGKLAASSLDWLLRDPELDRRDAHWFDTAMAAGRDQRHSRALARMAAASGGAIAAKALPNLPDIVYQHDNDGPAEPLVPLPLPTVPAPWRMTSFSALTREKHPFAGGDEPSAAVESGGPANAFAGAPGGTAIGTAIHDWIERWNMGPPDAAALAAHLQRYPLPQPREGILADQVFDLLNHLRLARLPGINACLADICPHAEASEWGFQLPIDRRRPLGPQRLAEVFARHGKADYASLLADLPDEQLHGYLHGFIDRIFCHDGQWGVIDWKTNQLGEPASCYHPAALLQTAMHSHYVLQAWLYMVALRRFTGPEASLAGAWIVFLRGVERGSERGCLFIRYEAPLIADLDQLFAPALCAASLP